MPTRDEPDLDPALADAVRRAYVRPVDEGTASRHLSAIVAAAETEAGTPVPARRTRRVRHAWRPILGVGAVATLLLPAGLAAAGVSLPRAVGKPYRAVGITLPNQKPDAPASAPTPAPRPVAPPTSATTPAAPAPPPRAPRARRSPAAGEQRRATPGNAGTPSTSRRPVTPPAASSSSPGSKPSPPPPAARRPGAAAKKPPAAAKPGASRKPVEPAKSLKPAKPPAAPANPGQRRKPAVPAAASSPQTGSGRSNGQSKHVPG